MINPSILFHKIIQLLIYVEQYHTNTLKPYKERYNFLEFRHTMEVT